MPIAGSINPASPAREVLAGIFGGAGKPTGAKVAVPLILTADLQGDASVHGIQKPLRLRLPGGGCGQRGHR